MSIRVKLYAAIAVSVAGLALTAGVGIWALTHLSDRFDTVQQASDAQALALQLKYDVTDFNGWQTAYGYDNGASRPIFLASVARFRATHEKAQRRLRRPVERRLLTEIKAGADEFMQVDAVAWDALRAGRAGEVKRLFLGPEIRNFQHVARAAQALADVEDKRVTAEDRAFKSARKDALRWLILAAIVASLLVALLLITALDLARVAERQLHAPSGDAERTDPEAGG
jgi:CHASE3 domain sensor protein